MNSGNRTQRIPVAFLEDEEDCAAKAAKAMSEARLAQACWAARSIEQRVVHVRELRHLLAEHARALAEASAGQRGRPMSESMTAEVLPLLEACRFVERNAKRIIAPKRLGSLGRPAWLMGVSTVIQREPFGVVLVIGPGNYPLFIPGVEVVQALASGNAVLLKPAVGGVAAAQAFRELVVRAGFPPGLLALLSSSTEAARAAIDAGPDKVVFTGSAATGETILRQLAPHLIPAKMELSGCDGVIVRPDADLELTVKALAFGLRLNNGATCLSPKRVFVARSVATELEGRLAQLQSFCENNQTLGGREAARLRPLLENALALGAHFIAGGTRQDGSIQTPVILAGVRPEASILAQDVFLPVLALVTVADDREAVLRLNHCPFALGASIFTRDQQVACDLAARLNAGTVCVNDLIVPSADPRLPFGGRKRSGFGVTRGSDGLLELTRPKVVTMTRGAFRPAFEPPQPGDAELFGNFIRLAHGRGFRSRLGAVVSLIKNLLPRKSAIHRKVDERLS